MGMKRLATSKIMKKHLIYLPKTIRELLDVDIGDSITWVLRDGEIIVKKGSEEHHEKTG